MEEPTLQREAAERAEAYAPRPTGGAWRAGLSGGVVALVGLFAAGQFYGLRVRDHLLVVLPILAAASVAGFVAYRRARSRNRLAQIDELARGRADERSDRP
jgi:hypothetical protein